MANSTTSLSNSEYKSIPAWSNSDLSLIEKSPALIEWSKNAPGDGSDSVDLGTHIHCAVLEPDVFERDYVMMPSFGASKAGKESADLFRRNMAGKIILNEKTFGMVIAMRDSIFAHPVARHLLTSPGQSEVSIFGEIGGIKVKARPDRIVDPENFGGQHIVIDLKKSADIEKFAYSVRDFGYHRQNAFYSDIYKQLTGVRPRFVFVVVGEKRSIGRHPVRVWELDDVVVDAGRTSYLESLEKCREYEEFGVGVHIEELDMGRLIK